ncbi:minor capsid component [Caudoviricetes sp.]|nr:minor capsid component [Caudoviricetes sp.]
MGQLNDEDDTLFALLLAALLSLPPNATPGQIDAALSPVLLANDRVYSDIGRDLATRMGALADEEAEYQLALMQRTQDQRVEPLDVSSTVTDMLAVPIIGLTIADTIRGLAAKRSETIRRAVQAGFVNRQTPDEIMRSLRGTRSAGFTDGLFNTSRHHLETTIRTALSHAVSYTTAVFRALNPNIIRAVVWLSVLDTATSSWCIARAGKRYTADEAHRPIGHSYNWGAGPGRYHYNCRSTSAPLVDGEIPNVNTYADWLSRQSAARQDEVLGPTRGAMYRRGQVSVEGFLNNRGRLLTLDQLRARRAGAP